MDANKQKALDAALAQIERQFGKGTVMRMGDRTHDAIPAISTGSLGVDIALGIGGLPKGRVVEIYGPESSGKTTLTLSVIAECQKMGGTAAFIDAGSRNVIATSWSVADDDAFQIIQAFYLAGGATNPVRALGQAQAKLIDALPARTVAAFTVITAPPNVTWIRRR